MGKTILKSKDFRGIAFPKDSVKSLALKILNSHFKFHTKEEQLQQLHNVLNDPAAFEADEFWAPLVVQINGKPAANANYEVHELKPEAYFPVFGRKHIDNNAYQQMATAMRLPIAVSGALMPDAHYGYGLPIGGVLAADNAVIPYGVGLDIGCRMALSICTEPGDYVLRKTYEIEKALRKFTHFGNDGGLSFNMEHEVIDRPEFRETELLRRLHNKAYFQLGSSGTGNHFVELGIVELPEGNSMGLKAGSYTGILSHSGSRGMGATIAAHYTKIAMRKRGLPRQIAPLSWLRMDEQEGQEYWLAMNLAGDYARANHDCIHSNLLKALGLESVLKIENHHNFAWKEVHDGRELIVHRKGATPASVGELGIIPGNMVDSAYIVSGKGEPSSLRSASHGAGRRFSRKEAMETVTKTAMMDLLGKHGVRLIGGSREESPQAYKNVSDIICAQNDLVNIEGTFTPKVVRMNKT